MYNPFAAGRNIQVGLGGIITTAAVSAGIGAVAENRLHLGNAFTNTRTSAMNAVFTTSAADRSAARLEKSENVFKRAEIDRNRVVKKFG